MSSNITIKARFAPSPTGFMHLGNVRTALFNYLFARHHQGQFLLRIEDTDAARSTAEYDAALLRDLEWMGLNWQEGPYRQSGRQAIYDQYYEKLIASGRAYPCFCSEAQLTLARKVQRAAGKPPRYEGTCRGLSAADVAAKLHAGVQPTLRFRLPDHETVIFVDLVRGEQRFHTNDMGDFIIRRANGTPPFMYCSVIDDALMGVTHVLRGEDHLTNTPRQILILQALGLPVPQYGHIALIMGPDGSPLSKRHGSRSIMELRTQGFLPMALINYLARLGHYYGNENFLSCDELIAQFKIENLSKSAAKFNQQQLDFWQKQAIDRLSESQFLAWIAENKQAELLHGISVEKQSIFINTIKPNILFPQDVAHWAAICFDPNWAMSDTQKAALSQTDASYFKEAVIAVNQYAVDLKAIMGHLQRVLSIKGPALYQPFRLALTGHEHGPELAKLLLLIDIHIIKKRLQAACVNTIQ